MTKCRHQCSTIESDTTILKQLYLKVNERLYLPAAGYKTTWIEQLGICINAREYGKGQLIMDNPEKLATQGTKDDDKTTHKIGQPFGLLAH